MINDNKEPLLDVEHISIQFGGLKAVDDFSIKIEEGQIVGLIGPNGAGKTTVFNLLTGVYEPTPTTDEKGRDLGVGHVKINGKKIPHKLKPHQLVDYGLARTFQNIRLFKQMTVLDNVMVAFNHSMKTNIFSNAFRIFCPWVYQEEEKYKMKALELLSVFNLLDYAGLKADNLPYGEQRKLEIARAMATNPKVLLLDEPAAGMNPSETKELMEMIRFVRDKYHIAILLIEHDMNLVMNICEDITVLEYGKIIAHGAPDEIANNPRVIEAYLGKEEVS